MGSSKYILNPKQERDMAYIEQLMSGKIASNCIPSELIFGEPGAGKTSFGKYVAEKLGAHFIFAPCYEGIGAEQLVYNWDLGTLVDAMTDEKTAGRDAMKDGFLLQALKRSINEKVVLLIDEIDKAKPSVDTFLLTFLQEAMLNDPITGPIKGKKENIFIIFTSNKRRELEDALDRRFTLIREFNFPERDALIQQVETMLSVKNYNQTKFMFVIDLAIAYRKLTVEKKPSQNQIADLLQELHVIGSTTVGRKTAYKFKFDAMMWKLSQVATDHAAFMKYLESKYSLQGQRLISYIGSML